MGKPLLSKPITLPSYTLSTRSPLCKHVCRAQLTGYPSPSPLHKTTNSKSKHTADTMLRQSAALRAIVRPAVVGKKALNSGLGQTRRAHAISNPTLANIEKRWEAMPPQEQADLWMALRDRMKVDWTEMTLQEKKAAYWIAFGPHGPRAQTPPGEGKQVFWYTMGGLAVTAVLFFGIRAGARGTPHTMNKEYQEASDAY